MLSSAELGPKGCSADQIDGPDDVVGQHTERCFCAGFVDASCEKSSSGGHSFDRSAGVFGGASALTDQARIGLKTVIHSFQRVLVDMAADKATLCGRAARLE